MRAFDARYPPATQPKIDGPVLYVASRVLEGPTFHPDVVMPRPMPTRGPLAVATGILSALFPAPLTFHFPQEAAPGAVATPWVLTGDTSLWVPTDVDFEKRFRASMPIEMLLTPEVVLPEFDDDVAVGAAWRVLSCSEPEFVAFIAAQVSLVQETAAAHDHLPALVDSLPLPPRARSTLKAAAEEKRPLFDQRVLRDTIAECAAAHAAGTWRSHPTVTDNEAIILSALFPPALVSLRSVPAIITALWLMQAGSAFEDPEHDDAFAMVSALGYQSVARRLEWLDEGDRLARQWEVPDSHPSAARANPAPSVLRAHVGAEIGVSPTELIAGAALVVSASAIEVMRRGSAVIADEQWGVGPLREISPTLRDALHEQLTIDFDALGHEVLVAAGETYSGMGTLEMSASEILRANPLVRFGDAVVPVGFHATVVGAGLAARNAALTAAGAPGPTLGHMLEGATIDALASLGGLHTVITPDRIDEVVPRGAKRCDVIIIHGRRWLLVEIGSLTPNPRERVGTLRDLHRRCRDYHAKLDQAAETLPHIDAIAAHIGVPGPQSVSMMLVAADPIFGTPPFLDALKQERPDRQPRFVVSVAEVDLLARIGSLTDVPLQVELWQSNEQHSSLSASLTRVLNILRPQRSGRTAVDWHARLARPEPSSRAP